MIRLLRRIAARARNNGDSPGSRDGSPGSRGDSPGSRDGSTGPRGGSRRILGVAITMFVAIQLVLPLHYYLVRRDLHDERFAWRMFSPMRMTRCQPKLILDGKPFDLRSEFHEAWIETAARGRFTVIEAMGARLCKTHPGSEIRFSIDCTYLDRPPRTFGGYDMCTVPLL